LILKLSCFKLNLYIHVPSGLDRQISLGCQQYQCGIGDSSMALTSQISMNTASGSNARRLRCQKASAWGAQRMAQPRRLIAVPAAAGDSAATLSDLRQQLAAAVDREDYQLAARLRDALQ
jgi:UvrB/uvrC motif